MQSLTFLKSRIALRPLRRAAFGLAVLCLFSLMGVAVNAQDNGAKTLTFHNKAWQYDADNDVYWQIGVVYVANPVTTEYESLGIYVPGAYLKATANGDGTYTAEINAEGSVSGYTSATAPIVFPVNTPGYSAAEAPTAYSYDGVSSYLKAGFIYVQAGARGRNNGYDANGSLTYSGGAPWGVTDFKAAIRYYRYNQSILPGSTNRIFVFGMSGGGAQSTVIGATGDSELYFPYLQAIGAAMTDANGKAISDAVNGAMVWCPITSLDEANEAYEWNMGQYMSTGTRAEGTWTAVLSKDLAAKYAEYLNRLGLTDKDGNALTLEKSDTGVYAAGTYYDYLVKVMEQSLNNFLADTTFPYTKSSGGMGGFPGGGAPDGQMPQGAPPSGQMPQSAPSADATAEATGDASTTAAASTTYDTVQDYIASLNSDVEWVKYDAATNTATMSSLEAFVNHLKTASKSVPAFDDLSRSQAENDVFGNDASDALHFDQTVADLLTANRDLYASYSDWDSSLVDAYATDLKAVDVLGNSVAYRQNMYNPMYYLSSAYTGYQTSTAAPHWRIRTGIEQGDTASTVEVNLALALENYEGVKDVDFATVWGQGHTEAERTGNSTDNFIAWVNQVLSQ